MTQKVNRYGFKVGDRFKVIVEGTFNSDEIVVLDDDDGSDCPRFRSVDTGRTSYEYYSYLELLPSDPVEAAKKALEAAQAAYDNAKTEAARSASKLKPEDLKQLAVVRFKADRGLRLVIAHNGKVLMLAENGIITHSGTRSDLWILNNYENTNLTVKEFFNA